MRSRIIATALVGVALLPARGAGQGSYLVRLTNHVPSPQAMSEAKDLGRMPASNPVTLAVALSVNDPVALNQDVQAVSTPGNPAYGQYLTPDQFTAKYSPPQAEYDQIAEYFTSRGLTVSFKHPNRLVLDLEGRVDEVERALAVELHQYSLRDGRTAYATNAEPLISADHLGRIVGIGGLSDFAKRGTHLRTHAINPAHPLEVGSGNGGGLIPADLHTVYSLGGIAATGTGQTLGLFELDGYTDSDITSYASSYGIASPPPRQVVTVDGFNGLPTTNCANPNAPCPPLEVTLDIELMVAIAPGATKIIVYEAPNTDQGLMDTYAKIATDNLAKEVSTSWGLDEADTAPTVRSSETTSFMQMAMQGQSIFAAAGDSGAFDNPNNANQLVTDDPASNPYVVGVGGTTLAVNGGETYRAEATWGSGAQGGGGGLSQFFPMPTYQAGLASTLNQAGNTTFRMVPDVSLVADPNTGYEIKFLGADGIVGGTSCAAPMWAAFTALVNETRAGAAMALVGFANPAIYALAQSSKYSMDFHDVNDGSTNLFYRAEPGYDLATGWGSFNGAGLYGGLTAAVLPTLPPTGLAGTPHNRIMNLAWQTTSGAVSYNLARGTSASGPFSALLSSTTAVTYLDTGLQNGVQYYYVLSTVNTGGQSGNSIPLKISAAAMVPQAPTGLALTGVGSQ